MQLEREAKAPPLYVARTQVNGVSLSLEEVRRRMGSKVHVVLPPEPDAREAQDVVEGQESAQSMLDRGDIGIGYVPFPYLQNANPVQDGGSGEEFHPHLVLVASISKDGLRSVVSSCVRSFLPCTLRW
jgi:hypothetical protein